MKKICLGLILGLSLWWWSGPIRAESMPATESAVTREEISRPVDYYLPYSGLLPDHPLYWLKMIRDRVELWLEVKPVAKANRLLLYADKRLGAGWALTEKGKDQLGVTTLTKAEKYLERAIVVAKSLNDGERETEFKDKLEKAVRKHKQVLLLIRENLDEKEKRIVDQMIGPRQKKAQVVSYLAQQGKTVLEMLKTKGEQEGFEVRVKEYDFGSLVESIKGKRNNKNKAWIYFVNGQAVKVGADKYILKDGDKVEWRYVKPSY